MTVVRWPTQAGTIVATLRIGHCVLSIQYSFPRPASPASPREIVLFFKLASILFRRNRVRYIRSDGDTTKVAPRGKWLCGTGLRARKVARVTIPRRLPKIRDRVHHEISRHALASSGWWERALHPPACGRVARNEREQVRLPRRAEDLETHAVADREAIRAFVATARVPVASRY